MNGIHQLLIYTDYVDCVGKHINARKEITEAPLDASKEDGLEVNAETEHSGFILVTRDQDKIRI